MRTHRWMPIAAAVLALFAVAGGAVVLQRVNPAEQSLFPICRFHQVTGLQCPGCGATRATHHLLNGRIQTAFYFNALYVVLLPGLLAWGGWWLWRWGKNCPVSRRAAWVNAWLGGGVIAALLVFWVIRNLPGWPLM